jgi:chemotaxis protein MotB
MDDADFAMFELGTTILTKEARGHTDPLPWRKGVTANNWSLSTCRAEATRQALVLSGVPPQRITRIEGVAETEPLIGDDPADPRNPRISLLLLEGRGVGARAVNCPSMAAKPTP